MPETVISIYNVDKTYHRGSVEIPVLRKINLEVAQGEFIALMGPSGSGKTRLLNLIAGIDRHSSGQVTVAGKDISKLSEKFLAGWRARHIGLIFQIYIF